MLTLTTSHCAFSATTVEPNPPVWPSSVKIFGPGDTADIESSVAAAYATNGGHEPANHGQFSSSRYAFLFKPGSYNVDVPVGYYTQVLGLGNDPSEVVFTSERGVFSEEQDYSIGGALSTFWRSAENFRSSATHDWQVGTGMMWAVSQASPLRRIIVDNNLLLFEYQPPIPAAGMASGGFMANLRVGGEVISGSQQQWFARDSTVGSWNGGVWNMVFTGVEGAPASECGSGGPFTTVATTPLVAEKPYVTIEDDGTFSLQLPAPKSASSGANFDSNAQSVGFESVYVAKEGDSAATINAKLAAGLHIVFSPAIYVLDAPLLVRTPGQVLLGLGLATLVSGNANTLIQVGDVDGVRVAGLILQAGTPDASGAVAPSLLEWGSGSYEGSAASPGMMHDVFARVGGPDGDESSKVGVTTMVHLKNGNVIGDNMWLWRADHAAGGVVTYSSNTCDHGIIVDGDDVTMYGLAVEHTLKDLTLWNGERGRTYYYQSELPYGVTQAQFGDPGYVGYRVADTVSAHGAWGVGVYSYFRDYDVSVATGIVAPADLEPSFVAPLSVFLNGNGGITHVINDKGGASFGPTTSVNYVC